MVNLVYRAACWLAMTDKPEPVDYFGVFVFVYVIAVLSTFFISALTVAIYDFVV
jgi:hypothetical protein